MSCCAVIDTNVLVSALLSSHEDSATVLVLRRIFSGEIVPLLSKAILDEYNAVLRRPKFRLPEQAVTALLDGLRETAIFIEPGSSGEQLIDPKDLPFYEVALDAQDDDAKLVTGNIRHFPKVPFVVTPRQMLDILNSKI